MPGDDLTRFLSLADVAEVLGLDAEQARDLVESGELPAIRLGRQRLWRVERDALDAFIAGKYEESRRMALWRQAQFSGVADFGHDDRR